MNTQISANIKARETKFGMQVAVYHTLLELISNFGWHAYSIVFYNFNNQHFEFIL